MRAAVCRAFGEPLVVEDVVLDPPGPGELKVQVAACAVCHSDITYAEGGSGGVLPAVYGHEAAGVVVEVGEGIRHFQAGDHVVVTLIRSCGRCVACTQGTTVTCETRFALDSKSPLRRTDGQPLVHGLRTAAFAEYVVVEASQAVAIPKRLSLDSASLLAWGVARLVVALDLVDAKLEAARRFGATHALRADRPGVVDEVRRLFGGRGADYVFVAVGARPAVEQAMTLAARSSAVVLVGIPASGVTVEIDPGNVASDNQRILGSKMGDARIRKDIPKLIGLYEAGILKLDELISGRYPLERINDAIASVKRGGALRNVIVFR